MANQEGVGFYQITTRNGRRMSAARAYLHPALKRENCELITRAQVTRILFDGKTANAVEFMHVISADASKRIEKSLLAQAR